MKHVLLLPLVILSGVSVCLADDKGNSVDFSDPSKVVQEIFTAAKSKNTSRLSSLCDPKGKNDGDTKDICTIGPKHKKWNSFLEWFAKGKLKGQAVITGDRAKVPFFFGPNGKKTEEMNLVKRDNKWYLSSF